MSTIKSSDEHLTLNADGTSKDIKFQANGVEKASISSAGAFTSTTIDATKLTGDLPAISAASLTNVPKDVTVGGRKNLIINGGFDLWQRGTSLAGANKFLADRWFNTTSATQSRQTFTVGQTDVPHNPTYYYRQVTGSSEWYETRHKIENVALTAGREVTLSYWMKASSAFTNAPYRVQNFGSGGSSEVSAALTTASVTTSWAKYTQTFTLPSVSGKTIGANSYLQIHILRANLNNVTVDIANVQLEYGDTATDFEQRSYGEELALCQRYYYLHATKEGGAHMIGSAAFQTANFADFNIHFPTAMRTNPSLEYVSGTDYYSVYANDQLDHFSTFATRNTSPNGAQIYTNGGMEQNIPQGVAGIAYTRNDNAFIAFTAEL